MNALASPPEGREGGRGLSKEEILRGREAFHSVFKEGNTVKGELLRLHIRQGTSPDSVGVRVGFAVAGTFRLAVQRNRARRLMREAYRRSRPGLLVAFREAQTGADIVFLYHGGPDVRDPRRVKMQEVLLDLDRLVAKLSGRLVKVGPPQEKSSG